MALDSQRTRSGFFGTLMPAILLAAIALASWGCTEGQTDSLLLVEGLRLTKLPSGAKIISGSVHNGSDVDVAGVLVQISLFDSDNHLLSSMTVGVEDVAAGGDSRFREPVDTDLNVHRARVKKIVSL
jgi:hypothetical protein